MPPKKRYAEVFKVGLGYLEVFLLERIMGAAGGTQSDHIRLAIKYYAKHHPVARPEFLREAAKNFAARNIKSPEVRDRLRAEVERFLSEEVTFISRPLESSDAGGLPLLDAPVLDIDDDDLEE